MMNIYRLLMPLALGFLLVFAGAGTAHAQRLFTVSGVEVEREARSASEARQQALVTAQETAWANLMDRLVASTDRDLVPAPSRDALDRLVLSLQVREEKTTNRSYRALFDISFSPEGVRQILDGAGASYTESASAPYLLVPVLEQGGVLYLWQQDNPWLEGFRAASPANYLISYQLPGSRGPLLGLSPEMALSGRTAALESTARRAGADGVVVAQARIAAKPSGRGLELVYQAQPHPDLLGTVSGRVAFDPENSDTSFRAAAAELMAALDVAWKERTLLGEAALADMTVIAPIRGLEDWRAILGRLERVSLIRDADVRALALTEGRLALRFAGRPDQLALAMAQESLQLDQIGDQWYLRTAELAAQQRARAVEEAAERPTDPTAGSSSIRDEQPAGVQRPDDAVTGGETD